MQKVTIGVGEKPLTPAERDLVLIDTSNPRSRSIIFKDNIGRIFADVSNLEALMQRQTLEGIKDLAKVLPEIEPYRDTTYFSDGFNTGIRITFGLYHTFRMVRHPGYKAQGSIAYKLPEEFTRKARGVYLETENEDFNKLQTKLVVQAEPDIGAADSGYNPELVYDSGVSQGADFMAQCLAERQTALTVDYFTEELVEKLANI